MSDEGDFHCALGHRLYRMELERGVHMLERALGRMALRTPVLVGYIRLNPVR